MSSHFPSKLELFNLIELYIFLCKACRFATLQKIKCAMAGWILCMRFRCGTGDAMGMNIVSEGVQCVFDYLLNNFNMEVISTSSAVLFL